MGHFLVVRVPQHVAATECWAVSLPQRQNMCLLRRGRRRCMWSADLRTIVAVRTGARSCGAGEGARHSGVWAQARRKPQGSTP